MKSATVVKFPKQVASGLKCSECGATAKAACNCGAPYIPAGRLAADAIAKSPDKSDRAIADEIGVSHRTVNRARKSTGTNDPVAKRTGKDGKARRLPEYKNKAEAEAAWGHAFSSACDVNPEDPKEVAEEGDTPAMIWARIFEYRSTESIRFAKDSLADIGKAEVNSKMIKASAAVVAAWTKLHNNLKRRK